MAALTHSSRPQRGVVLLFSLIALVVLMIGAAALVRSFNTSLLMAGNIGFKRDLQNQGERAYTLALRAFNTSGTGTGTATCASGALSSTLSRESDLAGCNYYAAMLPSSSVNAQSIPTLLTNCAPSSSGCTLKRLNTASDASIDPSVDIVYVIDRMCSATGNARTLGAAGCALVSQSCLGTTAQGGMRSAATCGTGNQAAIPVVVLYRLSVFVTGPRNTRSFFQSTFSVSS